MNEHVEKPATEFFRKWTHRPSFEEGGVRFRFWAPTQERVRLALEDRVALPMHKGEDGFFWSFRGRTKLRSAVPVRTRRWDAGRALPKIG